MPESKLAWKPNWEETKRHFREWWEHRGLVLSMWGAVNVGVPREPAEDPGPPKDLRQKWLDPVWRAKANHRRLACSSFPGDVLPIADTNIGPGSLALMIGSAPNLAENTVWYSPTMKDDERPERRKPLKFSPRNRWWKVSFAIVEECANLARGKYLVGAPDLIENIDTLASLRDSGTLLTDLVDRPEWVLEKLTEINRVWFEAYRKIYDAIKLEDGSSAFGAFAIWGPGKTAKVQCDASAMFSPKMFEKFVLPALTEQCDWLDNSMYHLDGHQCICHLDALLSIEPLDAIEWTPDPQVPPGGDPRWYPMYRKILKAGKSVQIVHPTNEQILRILDAIGGKGVYIMAGFKTEKEAEAMLKKVEAYRK